MMCTGRWGFVRLRFSRAATAQKLGTPGMVMTSSLPAEAVWEDLSQVEGAKSYFSTILIREEG